MKEIQSLSITIPTHGCVNNCKYCVSKLHTDSWIKPINCKSLDSEKIKDLRLNISGGRVSMTFIPHKADTERISYFIENKDIFQNFYDRLKFARDNGVNTVILTGSNGEILQNKPFLVLFYILNSLLPDPFIWIEVQTSGVMLNDENDDNIKFLKELGVKTISLSLSYVFDSDTNADITEISPKLAFSIPDLCKKIKDYDFSLRLSLNMTDGYNDRIPSEFFYKARVLNADQITFRILFNSENDTIEDKWIKEHRTDNKLIKDINSYIKEHGTLLDVLTFGALQYDVDGISTVVDSDCMNVEVKNTLKYLILRENLKLYSKWDKKSSLLF